VGAKKNVVQGTISRKIRLTTKRAGIRLPSDGKKSNLGTQHWEGGAMTIERLMDILADHDIQNVRVRDNELWGQSWYSQGGKTFLGESERIGATLTEVLAWLGY
jgi:hypothetical protein